MASLLRYFTFSIFTFFIITSSQAKDALPATPTDKGAPEQQGPVVMPPPYIKIQTEAEKAAEAQTKKNAEEQTKKNKGKSENR